MKSWKNIWTNVQILIAIALLIGCTIVVQSARITNADDVEVQPAEEEVGNSVTVVVPVQEFDGRDQNPTEEMTGKVVFKGQLF